MKNLLNSGVGIKKLSLFSVGGKDGGTLKEKNLEHPDLKKNSLENET